LPASTGLDSCQLTGTAKGWQGSDSPISTPFPRLARILYDGWPLEDDQVKRVKQANDIVAVIGGIIPLRPVGRTYQGLCPFHDDHRPSFAVSPEWQNFRCWSCNKYGDVITFVQEFEHVGFREALELLARRAGIKLEKSADSPQARRRAAMLDVVRWAVQQFHECLLTSPLAEEARRYLDERGLEDETVRAWGLGYAPLAGDWLVRRAGDGQVDLELLEAAGVIAASSEGPGYYCRFRDRVQFPIRDVQARPVGFGGRILPSSPLASRGPKYYNSSDTPLFSKSELLYGLDRARRAIGNAGYVAVVEGYTDVLMAHQFGVEHVVATMGTALNERHVRQLRLYAPRVVLVFDSDAGGNKGVDSALEIFAGQGIDLAVASLPDGLDPCDMLVRDGAEAFCQVLDNAVDALEFKLNQVTAGEDARSVEGQRRAVDAVLGVLARIPVLDDVPGADKADVKTQLMVTRIARRFSLKEETVWARLDELRSGQRGPAAAKARTAPRGENMPADADGGSQRGKAAPEERQLLSLLLADESLVPVAAVEVRPEEIRHSGLRRLLAGLYALQAEKQPPTLDCLRSRIDNGELLEAALKLQGIGRSESDPEYRLRLLQDLLEHYTEQRNRPFKEKLHNQLHAASDHQTALELFRQLQNQHPGEGGAMPPSQS
jgi:DNA primase